MLRDVSAVDTRTSILGDVIDFPLCVGVTAMPHDDGECATARGITYKDVFS